MAQHGVSHATTSAGTSSLLSVGAEARRPSKPQYVQTKKQPLGEGSFAKVYEAMNQETREIVAMKKERPTRVPPLVTHLVPRVPGPRMLTRARLCR
jgi:hypothetical protein